MVTPLLTHWNYLSLAEKNRYISFQFHEAKVIWIIPNVLLTIEPWLGCDCHGNNKYYTVKPVYNDHLMGYFSAFRNC